MGKAIGKGLLTLGMALGLVLFADLSRSQDRALLMKEADLLYEGRADLEKCRKSIEIYKKILELDPQNEEAAWKIARSCYWLGTHSPKEKRIPIFEEGIAAAKKAVALHPKSLGGHFWLGVSYGVYGEEKGVTKSLSLVEPIKKAMQAILEIDPSYMEGGAHKVLGRLYYKLPGLFGGDKAKSVEHLKKAIEYGPNNPMNRLYLAETYLKMGKDEWARKELETAIALPDRNDPQDAEDREKAKKLLAEHFGRRLQ